jgi:hypothetical protein
MRRGPAAGTPPPPPAAGGYVDLITALFVAVLLISNIASTKLLQLGPFTFDGGTILFPLSYIFGDILTEVYGYARSRRVIWTGFLSAGLMSGILFVVGALPPAGDWSGQEAYDLILGQTPRIVAGSLVAFWAGEFSNSAVLSVLKVRTGGRWLFVRTIGSTLVGEGVDTILFILIAFAGVWPPQVLGEVFVSNYVFKVGVEVLFTPVTYRLVSFLKRVEGSDPFDRGISLNPFRF